MLFSELVKNLIEKKILKDKIEKQIHELKKKKNKLE